MVTPNVREVKPGLKYPESGPAVLGGVTLRRRYR